MSLCTHRARRTGRLCAGPLRVPGHECLPHDHHPVAGLPDGFSYALVAFLIPYIFVFDPSILLMGTGFEIVEGTLPLNDVNFNQEWGECESHGWVASPAL